jgi:hypothetical protein
MQGTKYIPGSEAELSLDAVTTGTGTEHPFNDCRQVGWDVLGDGAIADGEVTIESAPYSGYAGTWNQLDVIDATTLTGGAAYHGTYPGPLAFVRGRVSDNITGGGDVTVRLNGLLG